jgi:hypothetical protein
MKFSIRNTTKKHFTPWIFIHSVVAEMRTDFITQEHSDDIHGITFNLIVKENGLEANGLLVMEI